MIERLCEKCSKPVKNKLFRGMRMNCYDRSRKISSVAVPNKLEPLFNEYMGDHEDTAKGIIELMELGLKIWKSGQKAAHITARHAARGRLAHQICRVEICPCRLDFS